MKDPVLRFITDDGLVHGVRVVANGEVSWCWALASEKTISSYGKRATWSTEYVTCIDCLANQPPES